MIDRLFVAVIDDDRSVRRALERLLRTVQMDVKTYSSAEKFLLAAARPEPDCLVLDVRMPGITGPELRDLLAGLGRRIPIVFITAHEEDAAPERGLAGGGADVLRKPFGDEALLDAIGRAIQRRDAT